MNHKKYRNLVNQSAEVICHLCGLPILSRKEFSKDHCPPLSRGGRKNDWKPAHRSCNNTRGALTLEEYQLWLILKQKRHGVQK
jgi:hypothetical protein